MCRQNFQKLIKIFENLSNEFVKNEAGSGSESMTLDMTRRMCSLQHVFSIECVLYSNEYDIGHSAQNQMQRPESKIVERIANLIHGIAVVSGVSDYTLGSTVTLRE